MFAELTPLSGGLLLLLAAGAVLIGFSKTAVSGFGVLVAALYAAVLPAKASTGTILPLLIVGDLWAVTAYRAHVDRRTLARLAPAVLLGIGAGVLFISRVDDTVMRRTIGVVTLSLLALQLLTRRRRRAAAEPGADRPRGGLTSWLYGSMSGFTTMVANAGGPAMSLYLLSRRFPMLDFLGTTAWFFFLINVFKVPFNVGLGLITWTSLRLDLLLAPGVLLGAWLGRRVIRYVRQDVFEALVLVTTGLAGLNLLR